MPTIQVTQPITVQLLSSAGVCWQAVYSFRAIKSQVGPRGLDKGRGRLSAA
jgi:hypothetical protein